MTYDAIDVHVMRKMDFLRIKEALINWLDFGYSVERFLGLDDD